MPVQTNKTFRVEANAKQSWVVIRQMPHDPQYKVGSRIPGYGKVVGEKSPAAHTAERYDYVRQAWIGTDGRYLCCAHLPSMNCTCYGKLHYGELAQIAEEDEIERARR